MDLNQRKLKFTVIVMITCFCMLLTRQISAEGTPIKMFVDGKEVVSSAKPVVKDGELYLPIRPILEAYGFQLRWSGMDKSIRAVHQQRILTLYTEKGILFVDGVKNQLAWNVIKVQNQVYIPLSMINPVLTNDYIWDQEGKQVRIRSSFVHPPGSEPKLSESDEPQPKLEQPEQQKEPESQLELLEPGAVQKLTSIHDDANQFALTSLFTQNIAISNQYDISLLLNNNSNRTIYFSIAPGNQTIRRLKKLTVIDRPCSDSVSSGPCGNVIENFNDLIGNLKPIQDSQGGLQNVAVAAHQEESIVVTMSNVTAEKLYLNGSYYVEGSKEASVSYKLEYEVSKALK